MSLPKSVKSFLCKLGIDSNISVDEFKLAFTILNTNKKLFIKTNTELIETKTSSHLGQMGEETIYNILKDKYKIISDSKTFHSGDFIIEINGIQILIEIKNYKNSVPSHEVKKMYDDIRRQGTRAGLFISLNSDISNIKKHIHLETTVINGCDIPVIFVNTKDIGLYLNDLLYYNIDLLYSYCVKNKSISNDIKTKLNDINLQIQNMSQIRVLLNEIIQYNQSKLSNILLELIMFEERLKNTIRTLSQDSIVEDNIKSFIHNYNDDIKLSSLLQNRNFICINNSLISENKAIELFIHKKILNCKISIDYKKAEELGIGNISGLYTYDGRYLTIIVNEITYDTVQIMFNYML